MPQIVKFTGEFQSGSGGRGYDWQKYLHAFPRPSVELLVMAMFHEIVVQ